MFISSTSQILTLLNPINHFLLCACQAILAERGGSTPLVLLVPRWTPPLVITFEFNINTRVL